MLNKETRLIHFFGPDGAGKSVQSRFLAGFLEDQGLRVRVFWLRAHHTFAFLLWKVLMWLGFYRVVHDSNSTMRFPRVNRDTLLRNFWILVEFASVLPLVLRAQTLIGRGYHLVADRYILDTIAAIAYVVDDADFVKGRVSRLLLRFIPRNTVLIFLNADYKTIRNRRNYENRKVEPEVFIEFQRSVYRLLAKHLGALTVDTSDKSIHETSASILQLVKQNYVNEQQSAGNQA